MTRLCYFLTYGWALSALWCIYSIAAGTASWWVPIALATSTAVMDFNVQADTAIARMTRKN